MFHVAVEIKFDDSSEKIRFEILIKLNFLHMKISFYLEVLFLKAFNDRCIIKHT